MIDCRYHAFQDKPYDFPSDEHEAYRLDGLHDLTKVLFHKNVLAPIEDGPGTKILDFGTGSGFFANSNSLMAQANGQSTLQTNMLMPLSTA